VIYLEDIVYPGGYKGKFPESCRDLNNEFIPIAYEELVDQLICEGFSVDEAIYGVWKLVIFN
jgi:hypothetical protein